MKAIWLERAAVLVLALLHVGLVLRHYPPSLASPERPVCSGDLHWHFASAVEAREVLSLRSPLWGYSPNYMAGYPYGLWNSTGRRGYEFAALLLRAWPVARAFYAYLMATALLPPLLLVLAARVLGWRGRALVYVFAVGVIMFHFDNLVCYFWTFGNAGFAFVNALAVLYVACLAAGFERPRWHMTLAAGGLLALAGFLHPLVVVPALAGSLAACWFYRRELCSRRGLAHAIAVCAVGLLLLAPWLTALARFSDAPAIQESRSLPSGWKHLVMDLLSDRAYRHAYDRRFLLHAQLVLAALGGYLLYWRKERGPFALLATAGFAFSCTYALPYVPGLSRSEPYRYLVSFSLFAAIPISVGAVHFKRLLQRANRAGRLALLCVSVLLMPALGGYFFDLLGAWPAQGLGLHQMDIVRWIKENPGGPGRIACQDMVLGNMLRYYTGEPIIGGGISVTAPLKFSHAAVSEKRMGPTPVEEISPEDWLAFLDLYNVKYVIASSDATIRQFAECKSLLPVHEAGRYHVYRVDGAGSYVFGGEPRNLAVKAGPNLISVEGAPDGEFVLKFHYIPTLAASAGAELFPVLQGEDPVPFIGVRNTKGQPSFEIRNRTAWRKESGGLE